MRIVSLLFFCALCLVPPMAWAEGEGAAVTARIPKGAPVVLRLASLDRIDAMAKELVPLVKPFAPFAVAPLEGQPLSALMFGTSGLRPELVDRTQPAYLIVEGENIASAFVPAPAGATLEEPLEMPTGDVVTIENGLLCVRPKGSPAGEPRGAPTAMLEGDFAVHVYLDEVVTANRDLIQMGLGMGAAQAGQQMPGNMAGLTNAIPNLVMTALDGAHSFDYAITWDAGVIYNEGLLRAKPDSALAKFFARAGAPGANPLIGYLPTDAMMVVDFIANPDWPGRELMDFMKKSLGDDMGAVVGQMLSFSSVMWDSMAGRTALSFSMAGMLGMQMVQIMELKEGVDPKTLFENFKVEQMNEAFLKMGVPMSYKLDRAIDKHGETELHRLTMQSQDPQLAMVAGMSGSYMCAEGGNFYMVMGPTAVSDIKDLLDRVRAGQKVKHPHEIALAKFGRTHNLGVSFNLGGLKAMAPMLLMMAPDMAPVVEKIPDQLYITSSYSIVDGNLHWKGDLPVAKLAEIGAAIQAAMPQQGGEDQPGEAAPPPDEDFD